MGDTLPPEIQVSELPDGVRYRLPRGGRGRAAVLGLVLTAFGLFMAAGAAASLLAVVLIGRQGNLAVAVLVGTVFSVPPFALGLFLALSGFWLAVGRIELRLGAERLCSVLKIGPLTYFTRSRAVSDVRRLVVVSDQAQKSAVLAA